MGRGTRLQAGGEDTYVVPFFISAATEVGSITTISTTFVKMVTPMVGTISTTYWSAPWPCRVSEVFAELRSSVVGDGAKISLRKGAAGAETTALTPGNDVIRNAYGGSAVNYVVCVVSAANTMTNVRYVGKLQDTSVATNLTGVAATETASGFFDTNAVLAAGERLYALYSLYAASDTFSHLKVYVTVAKLDSV